MDGGGWEWEPVVAGEAGRGGVPCRGGEPPKELDKAAARADFPGPGTLWPGPGSGLNLPELVASAGFGEADLNGGVVPRVFVGTGEAKRAVASARGTEVPNGPLREDANDDDSWAARGPPA